jgi:NAD+ synthase
MVDLRKALEIDLEKESKKIVEFIRKIVKDAGVGGVVVGMSGGVDSALTAALCVRALGPENVFGLMLPLSFTPSQDTDHAVKHAKQMEVRYEIVPIDMITRSFFKELKANMKDQRSKVAIGNVRARTRMVVLYYYANLHNALVAGTGDKSEDLIGFFTKYGDGGVDFLPISHLYKTQVRDMARYLEVPEEIAGKPASPQLHPGHQATDEIPIGYEEMDPILVGLVDKNMEPEDVAAATGVSIDTVNLIVKKMKTSEHKRKYPPMVVEW